MKKAVPKLTKEFYEAVTDAEFLVLFVLTLVTLLSGTIVYHFIEGWSFLDSFYFTTVTLTTVGYGDISPATDLGKIFTVIYLFTGIGIFLGFVNLVAGKVSKKWFN